MFLIIKKKKKKGKLSLSVTAANNHTWLQLMHWGAPNLRFLAYIARMALLTFPNTQKSQEKEKLTQSAVPQLLKEILRAQCLTLSPDTAVRGMQNLSIQKLV